MLYVVPEGVTLLKIDACGGKGCGGFIGGYVSAVIPVKASTTLYIYVGENGQCNGNGNGATAWNGGGPSLYYAGGGGTDIRSSFGGDDGSQALGTRLVVAGGAGAGQAGGNGGGLIGGSSSGGATGGTQKAGGVAISNCQNGELWQGGRGTDGGGGGFYGGGGGDVVGGAGGGSSYCTPEGVLMENAQGSSLCSSGAFLNITSAPPTPSQRPTLSPTMQPSSQGEPLPASYYAASSYTTTFSFQHDKQTYVVPEGIRWLQIDACGGAGGCNVRTSGLGGFVSAVIPAVPGSTLYVYVGGGGLGTVDPTYNGGGTTGPLMGEVGGGGTDIRTMDGGPDGGENVDSRLVVAGGGGGNNAGGQGGGLVGGAGCGGADGCNGNGGGAGGTQTAGGTQGPPTNGACGASNAGSKWKGGACGYGGGGGVITAAAAGSAPAAAALLIAHPQEAGW